jgi:hypothetical protein
LPLVAAAVQGIMEHCTAAKLEQEWRPRPSDEKHADMVRRIARSTNMEQNTSDPYGDGDQSPIPGVGFGGDANEDMR